jgi:hypothetical protein
MANDETMNEKLSRVLEAELTPIQRAKAMAEAGIISERDVEKVAEALKAKRPPVQRHRR